MVTIHKHGMAIVASVSTLGFLLAGCGASTGGNNRLSKDTGAVVEKPQMGGNITVDLTQAVPDLDPAVAVDSTSAEIDEQLYEPLVTYKKNTYQIVGDLAQSYEVSSGGLTYTFHIRKGVTYWNGDPLKAQDFVHEFERVLDAKLQPKPFPGSNFFLEILATPFISAVDPKFVGQVGNAALDTSKAMGTGPFELVSNGQDKVVLKRNSHYWEKDQYGNQLPYLNQVIFNINNNEQVDAMNWEQGSTALMTPWTIGGNGIPSSAYPTIMNKPKFKKLVVEQPLNKIAYIGLNVSKTLNGKPNPLRNGLVRRAMEYAFNQQQIIQLNHNEVLPLNQPLPNGMQGYVQQLDPDATYGLNINKAKQLMKQAGYANGITVNLYDQNLPDSIKVDQAIQAMMSQIGVKVVLHNTTWKDFISTASE